MPRDAAVPGRRPGSALLGFVKQDAAWLAERIVVDLEHTGAALRS